MAFNIKFVIFYLLSLQRLLLDQSKSSSVQNVRVESGENESIVLQTVEKHLQAVSMILSVIGLCGIG